MAEQNKVRLHGFWASPYAKRVEIALKIKGIPYEYVEEDLANKSPMLLQCNPVHKKVPLLLHNGNPIAESLVILEYIDETWKDGPQLLPHDPFRRAQVRFWANFLQEKIFGSMAMIARTEGEVQQKTIEELYEQLAVLENGMKGFFTDGNPGVDSKSLGLLEVILWSTFLFHKAQELVLGIKILDPEKFPLTFSWVNAINEAPVVKEATPPHEKLVGVLQFVRQSGRIL